MVNLVNIQTNLDHKAINIGRSVDIGRTINFILENIFRKLRTSLDFSQIDIDETLFLFQSIIFVLVGVVRSIFSSIMLISNISHSF